jgi:hypothetical protein
VPYSLKISTPSASEAKISDLKVGQRIEVQTAEDIRKKDNQEVTATSVTISNGLTSLSGKIVRVEGKKLTIHATPPSVAQEKDYQLVLSDGVEIIDSDIGTNNPGSKKTQLPASVLKKDTEVLIYTDQDINLSELPNALKVEVIGRTPSFPPSATTGNISPANQ